MRKSVSISCPSFQATLKNVRRAACGLLATLAFTMPVQAVDLLYVSMVDNTIATFDVSSGNAATIASSKLTFASLTSPQGLVFDSSGNLYAAGAATNDISKITPGGVVSQFATGVTQPGPLAIDSSGNLFAGEAGGTAIKQITPGGVVSTFATGLVNPSGLTIDSSGNLYASANAVGNIQKVTTGGVVSTYATGMNSPNQLTIDSSGNLYVTNNVNGTVSKVTTGSVVSTFATGLGTPMGITIDSAGNFYVINGAGANTISKIDSTGNVLFAFNTGVGGVNLTFGATAVPEPSTYALAAIAAGVMGAIARRRKARKTA